MHRAIRAYLDAVAANGTRSFWQWCPAVLREAMEGAMAENNMVYRFLTADPDETSTPSMRIVIRHTPGAETQWLEFKKAFTAWMRYKQPNAHWDLKASDTGVFTRLGYEVRPVQVCKACGATGGSCCEGYSRANRSVRTLIINMELVRESRIATASTLPEDA